MLPIKNGLKQGDALSPLLFSFTLDCTIRRVQVIQDGLKLDGTQQVLVCAHDANILGGRVNAIWNTEAVGIASEEAGLGVNADETTYMVMSRDQTGR
jgi:hypothetical protein